MSLVKYDKTTGNVVDADGFVLICAPTHLTVKGFEQTDAKESIKELVSAGMTADDLIKLKHGGVI